MIQTPIHAAFTNNHLDIVKLLLLKKALLDVPDHAGMTVERLAKDSGIDLQELLFQALQDVKTTFTTTFNKLYQSDLVISSQH